jgi:hypothetical protein
MFLLPFEFAVPDLLYERELVGEIGDRLVQLGLQVEILTPAEVRRATAVNRQHALLSVPDTFAFAIAEVRGWGQLTGDGVLRELAAVEKINMHGVLWLLDQFADGDHLSFDRLVGLTRLFAHRDVVYRPMKYDVALLATRHK